MNIGFCLWIWLRIKRHGDVLEIVLHEPFLPFSGHSIKQTAGAVVHRVMSAVLLNAADRVWVATPEWHRRWRPYALGRRVEFQPLPVTSTIPVVEQTRAVRSIRRRYIREDGFLLGHFGGWDETTAHLLVQVLQAVQSVAKPAALVVVGRGGGSLRSKVMELAPALGPCVHASGGLPPDRVSAHIQACDVMLQPYRGGVDARRTSAMACIAHGTPVVTTCGRLTEPFWERSGVVLVPEGDATSFTKATLGILSDREERLQMATVSRGFYEERFALRHLIAALRANRPIAA